METVQAKKMQPLARGSLRMQSDKRLVKLFRRGTDPAFDELVRRYRTSLVNFAAAIAGRDRADDVVQDSLVKAHRSLSRDQPDEFGAWLYRIVRNTALNDIRDNGRHCHEELGHSAGLVEQPHEVLLRRERLAAVVAAVAELPDSQRKAIVGRELGGFTHDEIAQQLNLSTGATKQLIYRARLTLRDVVGAFIPYPVITWLVADATGIYTAGATGGAAAGAALTAAGGGSAAGGAGAVSGGLLAGIAGAGAAKVAVVALMAGGTIAAGIAVEAERNGGPGSTEAAAAAETAIGQSPGWTGVLRPITVSPKDGPGRPGADSGPGKAGGNRPGSLNRFAFDDDPRGGGREDGHQDGSEDDHWAAGADDGHEDDDGPAYSEDSGDDDRAEAPSREDSGPSEPEPPEYEAPEAPEQDDDPAPQDSGEDDSSGHHDDGSPSREH